MKTDHASLLRTFASEERDSAKQEALYAAADALQGLAEQADKLKRMLAVASQFEIGCLVKKDSGPQWNGQVVGYYSSSFTPEGIVIECTAPGALGQVHVEPSKRMRRRDEAEETSS